MKLHHVLMAVFTTAFAATAQAGDVSVGGKIGFMHANASGLDDPLNVGISVEYSLQESTNGILGVEGEYSSSVRNGDRRGGGDWGIDTLGAFGTYRTASPLYVKAKAGVVDQNVSGTSRVDDGLNFAFGVGVGLKTGNAVRFETEYTVLNDVSFISVGFNSAF